MPTRSTNEWVTALPAGDTQRQLLPAHNLILKLYDRTGDQITLDEVERIGKLSPFVLHRDTCRFPKTVSTGGGLCYDQMIMPNYWEYWDKSDKEVWQAACDANNVNHLKFHALKLLLEKRNSDKLARATKRLHLATWILAFFAATQVIVAVLRLTRS